MYSSLYGLRVGKPAIIPPDFEPFLKVLTEYFIPFHLSAIFTDIDSEIKNGVDYIVQHRQDDFNLAAPSAIIKWNNNGIPTIIRN